MDQDANGPDGGAVIWWPAYEAWVRLCDCFYAVGRAKTDDRKMK